MPSQADLALQALQQGGSLPAAPSGTQADIALAALAAPPQQATGSGGAVAGLKQGLYDAANGPAQLFNRVIPQGASNTLNAVDHWLYQKTGGAVGIDPQAGTLDNAIKLQNDQYEANRKAAGREGFDGWRAGGNVIGALPVAVATGGTSAPATFSAALGRGAVGGAVNGALAPVTNGADEYWSDKAGQTATGAVFGAGGAGAARTLAGLLSPVIGKAQKTLSDAGVTLTPGQWLGGGFKRAEDALTSVPIVGDFIKNAQRRSFEDLNTAALNRSLEPLGQKLPAGTTGREAVAFADKAISDAYDSTLAKIGAVHPDQQFGQGLSNLLSMVQNVPKDKAQQFASILRAEIGDRMNGGVMTAEGFKAADSNLGNMARGYMRSNDFDQQTLGNALLQAQVEMRDMLQRTAPPDLSAALQKANLAFANFLRPQRASASLGAESGVFTPEQLQNAVKALDQSKRKGSFTTGDALMQDLSESAKNVMGNKVPDSGTPYRSMTGLGIAGLAGKSVLPASMGPTAAASVPVLGTVGAAFTAPYTKLGGKVFDATMSASRPKQAQVLADLLRQLSAPAGATAGALAR